MRYECPVSTVINMVNTISQKIIKLVEGIDNNNINGISPGTNFVSDLNYSSLKMLKVLIMIESQFNIEFREEDLSTPEYFSTVESIAGLIKNKYL